jgi:hypothetical protein
MKRIVGCAGLALIAATVSADARVTRIEISKQEPFAAGQTFGSVGAYEKVIGRFYGELDPASPLNATIVDLDKAPRNARGKVEYSADFYILKPVDLGKGNGALFYELSNRGNKGILARFNNAAGSNDPTTAQHAGNGFLMQQGYALLWNGWMNGIGAANNALTVQLPVAANPSGPIVETVWDELLFNEADVKQARLTYKAHPPTSRRPGLVRARNTDESPPSAARQVGVRRRTDRVVLAGTAFKIGDTSPTGGKAIPGWLAGTALWPPAISSRSHATQPPTTPAQPAAAGRAPALNRTISQGNRRARYLPISS